MPIDTDGSSRQRLGFGSAMDVTEVFARRHTLPSFCVFAQSTRRPDGTWKWWHHTGVFAVDHRAADRPLLRVAADGWRTADGRYSATPMTVQAVLPDGATPRHCFRVYGVIPAGDDRPLRGIVVE